ncbi:MAG: AIR synthase-related protein, partial [Eubacteriales bacterium]
YAADILKKHNVHGCTDVTGFGLAGHGIEMARASGVSLELFACDMHFIPESKEYAAAFLVSSAGQKNRNNYAFNIDFEALSFAEAELLFDAQTSGGLLAALAPEDAQRALGELNELEIQSRIIGRVVGRQEKLIFFKEGTK